MRHPKLLTLAVLATSTAGLGMLAPPASATDCAASVACETTVTFALTASGGLQISVPATSDKVGAVDTDAGTVSHALGNVVVADERGVIGSWTSSVIATAFTTGTGPTLFTIPAANVAYWSGAATPTGVVTPTTTTLTSDLATPIDTSKAAVNGTLVIGDNTVTWQPTVVVTLPTSAVAGTYTGKVTHSVT